MASTERRPDLRPILELAPPDAEALAPLSVEAGWNQVAADWRFMLEQGCGFGVRGADGRWAGSALIFPLGPAIAWISMVLVTQTERGQGLGSRLLARCIEEARARGWVAGLDATEFGRPVYLPLGFRDVYALSRWRVPGGGMAVGDMPGLRVRSLERSDIPALAAYDTPASGFARADMLAHLLARAPRSAFGAFASDGSLRGYVLGRDGLRAPQVGPLIADDATVAQALAARALATVGPEAVIDVPDGHTGLCDWLRARGGNPVRHFMRMLLSESSVADSIDRVHALAGPELA